jgi:hypothetical protein
MDRIKLKVVDERESDADLRAPLILARNDVPTSRK